MPLRLCSVVGSLVLVLGSSSPAFAQKKAGPATAAPDSDQAVKPGSKADPASAASDTPGKAKRAKKGRKTKAAASAAPAEPKQEEVVESDVWERPPPDAEKPPPPPPKIEKKVVGDGKHISAGLVLGWGFLTDRKVARLGADPYGLAIGVRGGYSFDFQLYTGVFYTYYIGSTREGQTARLNTDSTTTTANYMQFGVEAGYDVWAGPVVMRPSLQIGAVLGFTNLASTLSPLGSVLFGPGVTVFKPWDGFFLGGDMRVNIVPGDGNSAFVVTLNGGLRFE